MSTATLADHLRGLSDARLAALFSERPDLAIPVPADMSVLSHRAHARMSVARALDQLDRFALQVVDALRLRQATRWSVRRADVRDLVVDGRRSTGDDGAVDRALDRLVDLALAWPDSDGVRLVGAVDEVSSPYPAELGRPVGALVAHHRTAEVAPILAAWHLPASPQPEASALLADAFADPAPVRKLVEAAPAGALAVLERLAAGPPVGVLRDARRPVTTDTADTPVRWLIAHGLLVAVDEDTVELPREVGVVLRGDAPLGVLRPAAPPVTPVAVRDVDSAGAGQVLELLRRTEALLDACAADPPRVLRGGGIGVRDVRRLARTAGVDEPLAAVVLEVAFAATLLDQTATADPEWLPAAGYDTWRAEPTERRWGRLARAWLAMTRLPGLVGQRDDRDRVVNVLSMEAERSGAPELRRLALSVLAEQPPGAAVDPDQVNAVLDWRLPRRGGPFRDGAVAATLAEAGTLGLVGRGALTGYGRTLLAGGGPERELAAILPDPLDHVLVQADLTVVAPGPLDPGLAGELGLVADVESAGGATVYRVTADTVRRALDAGRSATDLHALFAARSRTPVPQALTYLVDDVARRHGGLRAGPAGCYLRSDDTALLSEVLADRRCEALRLRRLAPTVVVSPLPTARLLEGLRAAGYAPVAEDAAGSVLLARPDVRRAAVRPRPVRRDPGLRPLDDEYLAEAVAAFRRGDEAAREARRAPVSTRPSHDRATDAATTLAVLERATHEHARVVLRFVDPYGVLASRTVRPVAVTGGYLRAEDDRTDVEHTFALHRVTSVTLAEDPTDDATSDPADDPGDAPPF